MGQRWGGGGGGEHQKSLVINHKIPRNANYWVNPEDRVLIDPNESELWEHQSLALNSTFLKSNVQ